ncbi:MAG: alpha/beta fold hydrolase [Acidimicrobiales bacterium]
MATCTERHGDLLPYLSTAATARDLDVLRRAVGDEQLTYLGFSYGTQLGATYAALFPDDIRVLVLDGAVGPNLTDDELALTQAKGFERAFGNFVAACRTDDACDAGPDAAATFERVRAEVEAGPIPVSTAGERRELQVGDFQYGVVGSPRPGAVGVPGPRPGRGRPR